MLINSAFLYRIPTHRLYPFAIRITQWPVKLNWCKSVLNPSSVHESYLSVPNLRQLHKMYRSTTPFGDVGRFVRSSVDRGSSAFPRMLKKVDSRCAVIPTVSTYRFIMTIQEPPYVAVAQRKQAEVAAAIPAAWRLPENLIPAGMLSPAESITEGPKQYGRVNVMDIPRRCGILTSKELELTENYDVRGLVSEMAEGRLKAEEVVRGFCKASYRKGSRCTCFPRTYHEGPSSEQPLRIS